MELEGPCIDHGRRGYGWGYARAYRKGKPIGLHILVLMEATGEERNGRFALHWCDNPRCINPKHLHWGTHQDNMRERNERGRARGGRLPGELSGKAKLTNAQVAEIKTIYSSGQVQQKDLAKKYGVSTAQICRILKGKARQWG
ncbi:HNH endonuclease [Burkholderia vietnamiensis]|jgi:hypothetical protein|uniref:HNH endonuclease n=1 Tax=Burkholderia vietnamiensis TaxID=60552 RepID=UPI0010414243|nr:HNH endonuclease [Burkholderia vietnamiensis]